MQLSIEGCVRAVCQKAGVVEIIVFALLKTFVFLLITLYNSRFFRFRN
jgi:hypothetical protein